MADDFVRQYPGNTVPIHRPKSLKANLLDEAIEWEAMKRANPKLVSQAYDDINDAMTVQHQATELHGPDAAERDRLKREEHQFLEAFGKGLADHLRGHGMRVIRCVADGEGTGWRVQVKDRENRPFDVAVTYDDAIKAGERFGVEMGADLMKTVARRLIGARSRYFERMQ